MAADGFDREALLKGLEESRQIMLDQFAHAAEVVGKTYAPGKWTVEEILAHVADAETVYWWRFSRAVAEEGAVVELFDQDKWVTNLDYKTRNPVLSMLQFQSMRDIMIHRIRGMSEEDLARECLHAERGRVPAWKWADIASKHGMHHAGQIIAIRAGTPWTTKVDY